VVSSNNKRTRKLEDYQVILIRQMRREGFRRKFIAERFGISIHTIQLLMSNSTYKDVR